MSKKLVKARVLADMPHLGLVNGMLVHGPAAQIEAMAKANALDAHPAAVKYLEELGVKPVELPEPEASAEAAAGEPPAAA